MKTYPQHEKPLLCPTKNKPMVWLGNVFWICDCCQIDRIKVQVKNEEEVEIALEALGGESK